MFFITRKSTGQVVGRDVAPELLELVLSSLPTGTYAVEDSDGRTSSSDRQAGAGDVCGGVAVLSRHNPQETLSLSRPIHDFG